MRINILYLGHKYNTTQINATGVRQSDWKAAQEKSCWSDQLNVSKSLPRKARRPMVSWPLSEIVWPTGPQVTVFPLKCEGFIFSISLFTCKVYPLQSRYFPEGEHFHKYFNQFYHIGTLYNYTKS